MIHQGHSAILSEAVTRHTRILADSSRNIRLFGIGVAIVMVAALYLTGLTSMGMISTDEPRYAAVGRAMAQSGDWITPKLWGQAWFEKPALLYWMTAAAFRLGLGPDLAPRLPIALLSIAFIGFFWLRMRRIFDDQVASYAAGILATTAGWLAYSHVAVTDLPLAAFFSAAVLLSLPPRPNRIAAAVALGLAALAKGLPAVVLFLPILGLDYRDWRRWFASWPIVAFTVVALPWYIACTLRNGWAFPYTFFIEHQFNRFRTDALQHVQPWWFYGPVFLLLLFPWFPVLPAAARQIRENKSTKWLAAVVVFGLVFFSASVNKLPGYVLPLIPSTCGLIGVALARSDRRERWLIVPVAILGILPALRSVLPEAVAHGLRAAQIPWASAAVALAITTAASIAIAVWLRPRVFTLAIVLAAGSFVWLEIDLFPSLDRAASARALWTTNHPECAPILARGMLYGLYYYSEKRLPDCAIVQKNANQLTGNEQAH